VNLIMEVATRGSACIPHFGNFLVSPHGLAFLHMDFVQVRIDGSQTVTVIDDHRSPVPRVRID